jgi:hypothetical protein
MVMLDFSESFCHSVTVSDTGSLRSSKPSSWADNAIRPENKVLISVNECLFSGEVSF